MFKNRRQAPAAEAEVWDLPIDQGVKILKLAARKSESAVDGVLRIMIDQDMKIEFATVEDLYESEMTMPSAKDISIPLPDLAVYDELRQCEMAGVQ